MSEDYNWLLKRQKRSVLNLRLWPQNPRLNPNEEYQGVRDFAEEMLTEKSDRLEFYELAEEIVSRGFLPFDPIVVWQNPENEKFYVAEGNRRVLVLKLLLSPSKAPRNMRKRFEKLSKRIDAATIQKIPVAVAPSFEDAEWYISQRHSPTSNQRKWSREQQHRWVARIYEKYNGNMEEIYNRISITESELYQIIATLELKKFVPELKGIVSNEVLEAANSIKKFPLSTFERLLHNPKVREHLAIEIEGRHIKLYGNRHKFLHAFGELLRRMLKPNSAEEKIDSRTINDGAGIDRVLATIEKVERADENDSDPSSTSKQSDNSEESSEGAPQEDPVPSVTKKSLKGDPNRMRLILPFYSLDTDRHRLAALFEELKNIPTHKYPNSVAAAIRVLLDVSVSYYFDDNPAFLLEIQKKKSRLLRDVPLKDRLEFIKEKLGRLKKGHSVIEKLTNPVNEFSLDVLNGYVHGSDSHYIGRNFLNRFWDFMFPLFQDMLEITEED